MITRCDAYQKLCKYKYINPKGKQRQLKSSFIETLFECKNVQNITFHRLQQLPHIYNNNNQRKYMSQLELFFVSLFFLSIQLIYTKTMNKLLQTVNVVFFTFLLSNKVLMKEDFSCLCLPFGFFYIYIYIYIWIFFCFSFFFPLTDPHISVTALLCVSLVNFLTQYCLCVNQLFRKKKQTNKQKVQVDLYISASFAVYF